MGPYMPSLPLVPKTAAQRAYVDLLRRTPRPHVVVGSGPAGCGKTLWATAVGCEKLANGEVERMVITRPAVAADEEHGFLPGGLDEKMAPWVQPILDAMSQRLSDAQIRRMKREKTIEFAPIAYMRGRTFHDTWIVCDESQNCTPNQLLMIMTRIGDRSKLIVAGDPDQYDRGEAHNGLADFMERLKKNPVDPDMISLVEFGPEDVQRHPVIPLVLDLYR
jgi:phosphate starvation-inducible protein PhoH and related proteins